MLVSRREWARLFLDEVEMHHIKEKNVAPDVVRQIGLYHDAEMDETREEALAVREREAQQRAVDRRDESHQGRARQRHRAMRRRAKSLSPSAARSATRSSMKAARSGPELTGYERNNSGLLAGGHSLPQRGDPRRVSAPISARCKDGQVFTGLIDKQDAGGVVIRDVAGQKHTVKQPDIESLEASPVSLMPEGLLGGMSDGDLRDLFAYLTVR